MKFDFTDQQINHIVQVLSQRPYSEVFELMNNIQRQAIMQSQPGPQLVSPAAPEGGNAAAG